MTIDRLQYILVKQECTIERIETDTISTAHGNIPSHVIDASTLGKY